MSSWLRIRTHLQICRLIPCNFQVVPMNWPLLSPKRPLDLPLRFHPFHSKLLLHYFVGLFQKKNLKTMAF
jgi:hypothetical protein